MSEARGDEVGLYIGEPRTGRAAGLTARRLHGRDKLHSVTTVNTEGVCQKVDSALEKGALRVCWQRDVAV